MKELEAILEAHQKQIQDLENQLISAKAEYKKDKIRYLTQLYNVELGKTVVLDLRDGQRYLVAEYEEQLQSTLPERNGLLGKKFRKDGTPANSNFGLDFLADHKRNIGFFDKEANKLVFNPD